MILQILLSHHITRKLVVGVDKAQLTQLSARAPNVGLNPSVAWVSFKLLDFLFGFRYFFLQLEIQFLVGKKFINHVVPSTKSKG